MTRTATDTAGLIAGIAKGDLRLLAKGITILESTAARDREAAERILSGLAAYADGAQQKDSRVVGFAGAPGVGKSSLIEAFGMHLLEASPAARLAVLTIDPSSPLSGGSLLGDKTRMDRLSRHPRCFIRPSPSGLAAGALSRRTHEAALLCAAAGFDTVFIETVGSGQGDHHIALLSDLVILLEMPGAGDQLQGMKRGILEFADLIAVTKADAGDAAATRLQLAAAVAERQEMPNQDRVIVTSALQSAGLQELNAAIITMLARMQDSGRLKERRQSRAEGLLFQEIMAEVAERLHADLQIARAVETAVSRMTAGKSTLRAAAQSVVDGLLPRGRPPV